MPAGDGTGPMGMGPMTGRAAGYCAGYGVPGYANPFGGRGYWGFGRGAWGRGRGYRHWYYATGLPGWARGGWMHYPYAYAPAAPYYAQPTPEQEVDILKQQAEYFQNALADINKRIEDLEQEAAKKD